MRTLMNFAAGYGASPSREPQYDLDGATAAGLLQAAEQVRDLTALYAVAVGEVLSAHDLWCADQAPGWSRQPHGDANSQRVARFRAALDELVDEFLHQGKLEEAGELV